MERSYALRRVHALRVPRVRSARCYAGRSRAEVERYGGPTVTLLRLDFETACDLDLKKVGLDAYARHPSCRILMASWALDDGPVQQWTCDTDRKLLQPLVDLLQDDSVDVEAHNTAFERAIIYHVLGVYIDLERCTCTMALAFMLGLPGGLEKLGEVVRMPEKYQKQKRGKYLIGKFCKPRKPTKNKPWAWDNSLSEPELWAEFCEYNRQDVEAERFLYVNRLSKYPVLPDEWDMWRLDQAINVRGIPLDTNFIESGVAYVDDKVKELLAQLRVVTGMTDPSENPNSDTQFGPWVRQRGYEFGDLRKETVERALADPLNDLTAQARKALKLRAQMKRTSLKKLHALKLMACDGRIRHQFQFCGAARTGRWGGRGAQPQNLPRPKKQFESDERQYDIIQSIKDDDRFWLEAAYPDPLTALSSSLRGAIRAQPGNKLVVVDLSSIESAVLAWLADCPAMLKVFADGKDIYKAFAVVWLRKAYEDITSYERNLAKPATLGCFAAGTEVLTSRGWVDIVHVSRADLIFDGVEFVKHGGVICQGQKETIALCGVDVTPEHLILVGERWMTSKCVASDVRLLQEALSSVSGLSFAMNGRYTGGKQRGGTLFGVSAGTRSFKPEAPQNRGKHHLARRALMRPFEQLSPWPVVTSCLVAWLSAYPTASTRFVPDALVGVESRKDTEAEESSAGLKLQKSLSNIASRYRAWRTQASKLIGQKTTGTTSQATSDSLRAHRTTVINGSTARLSIAVKHTARRIFGYIMQRSTARRVQSLAKSEKGYQPNKFSLTKQAAAVRTTYDIVDCGPRSRFVIRTTAGPLIAHNCGFRLGPGAEVVDRKTGDMKLTGLRGYARSMHVEMTDEQAQSAVTVFREAYPEVVQFWYDLEAAAKTVIYEGGKQTVGRLTFEMKSPFMRIVLPSGRALHYLRPKIEEVVTPWGATKMTVTYEGMEDDGERKFWGRTPTHGGKITENVVQAVANDLLRHGAMLFENETRRAA